jgi:hypothetical protein
MRPKTSSCAVTGLILMLALCALPASSRAYEMSGAGAKLGVTSPENLDNTVMVGGHLEFEKSDTRLHLMPNVMYWNVDHVSDLNPNMDVYYHFARDNETSPYLGGGLGLNVRNSDTALGANLIGGMRFPGRSNSYFVEGRFTASDQNQVAILGGVTFKTH